MGSSSPPSSWPSRLFFTTNRWRPAFFALYKARSAAWYSPSNSWPRRARYTPTLAVRLTVFWSPRARESCPQISAAFSRTSSSVSCPQRKATNSSPPSRPTTSLARKIPERIWAACRMAWSPARWPRVSFTCLKWSRSTMNRAQESSGPMACSRCLMLCSTVARFKSPERVSLVACRCSSRIVSSVHGVSLLSLIRITAFSVVLPRPGGSRFNAILQK